MTPYDERIPPIRNMDVLNDCWNRIGRVLRKKENLAISKMALVRRILDIVPLVTSTKRPFVARQNVGNVGSNYHILDMFAAFIGFRHPRRGS